MAWWDGGGGGSAGLRSPPRVHQTDRSHQGRENSESVRWRGETGRGRGQQGYEVHQEYIKQTEATKAEKTVSLLDGVVRRGGGGGSAGLRSPPRVHQTDRSHQGWENSESVRWRGETGGGGGQQGYEVHQEYIKQTEATKAEKTVSLLDGVVRRGGGGQQGYEVRQEYIKQAEAAKAEKTVSLLDGVVRRGGGGVSRVTKSTKSTSNRQKPPRLRKQWVC